ncbi:MAG: hypothetical protein RL754_192 [Bacteroidota bacterium]
MRGLIETNYAKGERQAVYSRENLDQVLTDALADPKIKCIYGHFPLRPVIAESDAFVFTMLREPIARSISHYNHYMSGHEPKHREVFGHVKSPEDFGKMVHSYNRQSVNVSGFLNRNKQILPDDVVWEQAMINLERINAVLFTEYYAESIAYLGEVLEWKNTPVEFRNRGSRKEIGHRTAWEAMNTTDLKLYELCLKRYLPELMKYSNVKPKIHWKYRIKRYLRDLSSKF